jgi:hypothetical protein
MLECRQCVCVALLVGTTGNAVGWRRALYLEGDARRALRAGGRRSIDRHTEAERTGPDALDLSGPASFSAAFGSSGVRDSGRFSCKPRPSRTTEPDSTLNPIGVTALLLVAAPKPWPVIDRAGARGPAWAG